MAYRSSAAVNFKGLQNELQNENATAPTLAKYKDGKAVSIRLYSDKKCTDLIYTFKTTLKAVDISNATFIFYYIRFSIMVSIRAHLTLP